MPRTIRAEDVWLPSLTKASITVLAPTHVQWGSACDQIFDRDAPRRSGTHGATGAASADSCLSAQVRRLNEFIAGQAHKGARRRRHRRPARGAGRHSPRR